MKAIALVGSTDQSQTLLADLLHWHGLSVFQVDQGNALLPLLSFISPELIIIESSLGRDAEIVCDRIKRSPVLGRVPVILCANQLGNNGSADAYVSSPHTAEEIFAHVQNLRPLTSPLDGVFTSAWSDS